ncbi:MAG: response regulator, partial [Pseudomonadota bacterium]
STILSILQRVAPASARILVVDDDPLVADLVRQSLNDQAYEIRALQDGARVAPLLDDWPPDVILLDLLMPGRDGFEVIEDLQQRGGDRPIPIVVLTAKDLTGQERAYLQDRVRAVITKNAMGSDELLLAIRAALNAHANEKSSLS